MCGFVSMNRRAKFNLRGDIGNASGFGIENLGDGLAVFFTGHDNDLAFAIVVFG
jgi:zinc transporter ZupT